jgi:hypothetical protein
LPAKDGEAMGEALMIKVNGEKEKGREKGMSASRFRVGEVFRDHLAFRQLTRKYPHFEGIMV